MTRTRTASAVLIAVLIAVVAAGCILIAAALYAPAWADGIEGSLLLVILLPAYLAVSYCTPMPTTKETQR